MPSLIYLASPYTHADPHIRQLRFDQVCHAAAYLMQEGKYIFSPIAHTHPIAEAGNLPTGWMYWREYDIRMIGACDELYVLLLPGVESSKGVSEEIKIAHSLNKPVKYIEMPFKAPRMPKYISEATAADIIARTGADAEITVPA